MFASLGRYDYTAQDCFKFHQSIKKTIKPIIEKSNLERKRKLGLNQLKPFDLEVDLDGKEALKPFINSDDLIKKSIACFDKLDKEFGDVLRKLNKLNHLDLDSRKGKAPGGYNYPLYHTGVPFIFMNSAGTFRDMITMLHEGGHAIHSIFTAHYPLIDNKSMPSEVAELASMTMELITIDYWNEFFENESDIKRAVSNHLISSLKSLIWIAIVDSFQHWIYENPYHTKEERGEKWNQLLNEFDSQLVDYSGYEKNKTYSWQKQLHIYEVPFYYIEYGFAQLGALAIYANYKKNAREAIEAYKKTLKMGYTDSIPQIYKAANISFDFSEQYVESIVNTVMNELEKLN
jgi:oligoendopeptidase F